MHSSKFLVPSIFSLGVFAVFATAQSPVPAQPEVTVAGEAAPQDPAGPKKLDPAQYEHFGAGILEGPWTELAVALAKPEDFVGRTLRLAGPITQVCQTKGCWMHLGTGEPPVMVKFKDYGFFVPKDASGRTVIVEGEMTLKQETVEQTRHYLEDAGKHAEAAKITEGRRLYHFVATGVAIEKPRD
jgi:hypothetical protein